MKCSNIICKVHKDVMTERMQCIGASHAQLNSRAAENADSTGLTRPQSSQLRLRIGWGHTGLKGLVVQ